MKLESTLEVIDCTWGLQPDAVVGWVAYEDPSSLHIGHSVLHVVPRLYSFLISTFSCHPIKKIPQNRV